MTDLNLRAARIQLYGLIAALVFAILIAAGITAGAFVLSFHVLRDLGLQGMLPEPLTWIFPAIVDGAILAATISSVVLNKVTGPSPGRTFFLCLLVSVVVASVAGNGYHAWRAAEEARALITAGADLGFTPLHPIGAALITVIPPLLVLAFTHGIGILIKAIGTAYSEYNELVNTTDATYDATSTAVAQQPAIVAEDTAPTVATSRFATTEPIATTATAVTRTLTEPAIDAAAAPAEPMLTSDDSAPVAPVAPPVAPVARTVAHDVAQSDSIASGVALRHATPEPARTAPDATIAPEQTTAALLEFIDTVPGLSDSVRTTARLKVTDPTMSFAAIAEETGGVAASTAMRRYKKAEEAALIAGFEMPPLPDLGENTLTTDLDRELGEFHELVTS
ncbi:DUF2637 domain-containing protein [Rhodococcus artemisiae]|uniref:DUF2637 domain-containing protein n=1 Tax=Rhodococcus artemisiae TaxID=714159 RepID=A0ABU7LJ32_9NOCA|nr:DUF2637 domain-containing protein [Rhodococcus artemisiae]MEE2061577.1 DUF2637 domain-containing protein [Rhodococcus artemisiae]